MWGDAPSYCNRNMKNIRTLAAALSVAAAFTIYAEPYKVIVPLSADENGALAVIHNYDTGEPVDSATVADQAAVFTGTIDEPFVARVAINGKRGPVFILESGTISFSKNYDAFGTMLNDRMRSIEEDFEKYSAEYNAATTDEGRQKAYDSLFAALDKAIDDNDDNPLGYYYFIQRLGTMQDAKEIRDMTAKYPAFSSTERSQSMLAAAEKREATQPGKKFVDFEVTYDGQTKRLSDYVGKGKYTLVDFWASWCGPCIRETKVIKELYNKYKDQGLDVLGVAVWDEPENTKSAIKAHQLPWENIINAQTIPTDLYGISGIPCIILFGPDGTIISRDKQDDDLRADVAKAMENE